MEKTHLIRRYLIFFVGLLLNAFGVAFVTKGGLGTSPIASIPYSMSLIITSMTMGTWVAIYNVLLVALQWVMLKKDANKAELALQVVIALTFGYFTDFGMRILSAWNPAFYPLRVVSLVIGCGIIACGAFLELVADVVMLPADAFVRTITKITGKEYGGVRVISDCTMAAIAAILCLLFLHKLVGVREGTVISALITGNMVKFVRRKGAPLEAFLLK